MNSDADSVANPPSSPPDNSSPPPPPPSSILIPGLPNEVSRTILSMVPYAHHARLKSTSKSWKSALSSKSFLNTLLGQNRNNLICIFPQDPSIASPYLFDANAVAWCPLPPMPCNPHVYGLCNFAAVAFGPHVYIIGGSLFDTRSFPINRPSPSSATFRFSFRDFSWESRAPMISPRGSFAYAVVPSSGEIIVAGGGSRHTVFAAAGSRIRAVERYDVVEDEWEELDPLPCFRAGCVGFVERGREEFWVVGGYSASRTVSGVFPVDEYCRDAAVMGLEDGSWREVGDTWGDGEDVRAGKIVVGDDSGSPLVFMLDGNEIFRYEMSSNRWEYESRVPKKAPLGSAFGIVVASGELYVLSHLYDDDFAETRRSRPYKKAGTMCFQIYNPKKKMWRTLVTKSPFTRHIDITSAVLSSIRL
ncbi:F-box/kelch-repeat protein OR23-like [Vicia villosa]|uniref:F-box/kelch-repeat protein OR23-like n=1 Tax=Vicia villosa TaxID=3911 RepID=UPI00273B4796|nr:F-box/kelch-repeat protein OR23-like [Vicia villosa]